MAKKADVFNVSNIDTVIGSGVKLKGNLASEGDVAVDGTLMGNISSGGHVTIGVNGKINGRIQAVSAQIAGHVEGNVTAADHTSIMSTGFVRGDITTGGLEVMMGGIFIGESKMKPAQATEIADVEETEAAASESQS